MASLRRLASFGRTLLGEDMEAFPEDPWRYFEKVPGVVLLPLSKLSLQHKRDAGLPSAMEKMRQAYEGTFPRRKPISVRKLSGDRFEVVDGNTTTTVAKEHGWKKIPAIVLPEATNELRTRVSLMLAIFDEWLGEETYPAGTIRNWKTGSVVKTREGEWVPYAQGSPHAQSKAPAPQPADAEVTNTLASLQKSGKLPKDISPEQQRAIGEKVLDKHRATFPKTLDKLKNLVVGEGTAVMGRVKDINSALEKLVRKPKYGTVDNLMDGTGFRIVCESVDDVLANVKKIKAEYETSSKDEEDYINKPKDGYRSYHLIIKDTDGFFKEVQLRTPNQDTWANWCHDVYKPHTPDQKKVLEELGPEIVKYGEQMSEYYYAKDQGKKDLPKPPQCPSAAEKAFGCLPL